MDNLVFKLPKNIAEAVQTAKVRLENLLEERFPIDVHIKMFIIGKNGWGRTCTTNVVTMRKCNPQKIDLWQNTLEDFLQTELPADNASLTDVPIKCINLHIKNRIVECYKICPCCQQKIITNFPRHVLGCGQRSVCPTCLKPCEELEEHMKTCRTRTYECRVCLHHFYTGAARTSHEKKCRQANPRTFNEEMVGTSADLSNLYRREEIAMEGLFRIIEFDPSMDVGSDYEGALTEKRDQVVEVLRNLRGNG